MLKSDISIKIIIQNRLTETWLNYNSNLFRSIEGRRSTGRIRGWSGEGRGRRRGRGREQDPE